MKWIAAKVTFDGPDRALATDLVADIFYDLDLKGVVVDDPEPDAGQDWGEDAIPPPGNTRCHRIFFRHTPVGRQVQSP